MTVPIIFKSYPYWPLITIADADRMLREITNIRNQDISVISQISSTFIMGRKVGKVPSASNDVVATDRVGDVNYDASYLYILIDNAGTPAWRRVALSSW